MHPLSMRARVGAPLGGDLPRDRRGSALVLVLVFTVALAALAMSALFLSSNATVLAKVNDREQELRFAADAALEMGRGKIAADVDALPVSGYDTLDIGTNRVTGADGVQLPDITVDIYAGPTGSGNGQTGAFASVVAVATDAKGGRMVRRLEVVRESFAKFAYYTNFETTPSGGAISFTGGDVLNGPVWSNSNISLTLNGSIGPIFRDSAATAGTFSNISNGTFQNGYAENRPAIALPSTASVARLRTIATAGQLAFTAPAGTQTLPSMRLEFVSVVFGGTQPDTVGFLKVYALNSPTNTTRAMLKGTFNINTSWENQDFCGDWHNVDGSTIRKFFPISAHDDAVLMDADLTSADEVLRADEVNGGLGPTQMRRIMTRPGSRCFPAGAPELAWTEGVGSTAPFVISLGTPGDSSAAGLTQYENGAVSNGRWLRPNWGSAGVPARLAAARPNDNLYLFPLDSAFRSTSKRVIDVQGNIALSGVVRGFFTLHTTGSVLIIDDLKYEKVPGSNNRCNDILGVVADSNVWFADNAMLVPQDIDESSSATWASFNSLDGQPHLTLQGLFMSLNTSIGTENYTSGPFSVIQCNAQPTGRGCLDLTGGFIQVRRGIVASGNSSGAFGYRKRYGYDVCGAQTPPPYFPTTGRFANNRYHEYDPTNFNIAALFASLSP